MSGDKNPSMRRAKCSELLYENKPTPTTPTSIKIISNNGAPATKYIKPQDARKRDAWPKSGCKAKSATTKTQTTKDIRLPGGPLTSKLAAISHAVKITKQGFKNSDG